MIKVANINVLIHLCLDKILKIKKMLMIIYYHDVSLGENNMQASKITIGTIIALLIFVAFGTVPLQSGYAQVSSQSNILVGPNAEVFGFVDIQSDGHSLNINGLANYLPPEGQVFEVWLLDAGYSSSSSFSQLNFLSNSKQPFAKCYQ